MKEFYINVDNESDIYSTFGGPEKLNGEYVDYVIGKLKDSELLEPVQLICSMGGRQRMDIGKSAVAPPQALGETHERKLYRHF